jgi:hypothetical protein
MPDADNMCVGFSAAGSANTVDTRRGQHQNRRSRAAPDWLFGAVPNQQAEVQVSCSGALAAWHSHGDGRWQRSRARRSRAPCPQGIPLVRPWKTTGRPAAGMRAGRPIGG